MPFFCLILFMQGEHDEFVWSDIKLPLPFLSWFVYHELFFFLIWALYCLRIMHICIEKSRWDDVASWYITKCLCYMPELEVVWLGNFRATDISRPICSLFLILCKTITFFRALRKTITWFIQLKLYHVWLSECEFGSEHVLKFVLIVLFTALWY